jgi:hypothetical protein
VGSLIELHLVPLSYGELGAITALLSAALKLFDLQTVAVFYLRNLDCFLITTAPMTTHILPSYIYDDTYYDHFFGAETAGTL